MIRKLFLFFALAYIPFIINIRIYSQSIPPFDDQQKQWVDSIYSNMTLEEKVGQLFMVAAYSNRDSSHEKEILDLIRNYHIGGLIFFQGGLVRQARLTNLYQEASKIPLLIAMDSEWGLGMRLDSTVSYPYQMALGAIKDNRLIYNMGQDIARQFHLLGMHINFAPVVDVNNNPENPVINFRSFGENKVRVAAKGIAYMQGLQDSHILACGKHFPGHGDTDTDSHYSLPVIHSSYEQLQSLELYPFKKLMEEGLGSVMVAHLNIPSLDPAPNLASTLSRPIVTGLLRDSLGFKGIVFTDALNMEAVARYFKPGEADLKALEAGNDILLFSKDVSKGIDLIVQAVKNKQIEEEEIDRHVRNILDLKYWAGLNKYQPVALEGLNEELNKPSSKVLNRDLVKASLTVLENKNNIVPLKRLDTLRLLVITIGENERDVLNDRIDDYTIADHIFINKEDDYFTVEDKLKGYNLFILNLKGLSQYASRNFGLSEKEIQLADLIMENNPTLLVWNGNPYGLSKFRNLDKARFAVVTYQENELTRDYAAQLLFGGIGARGRLPVSINDTYRVGDGLDTEGNIRFEYTIPEAAGLNGAYLTRKIDSIARFAIQHRVAPGIEVFVARNQKAVYLNTFGYHTYDSLRHVSPDDLFDFASVTKISSGLPALMHLHDQNKFKLDATLGDYLRYFHHGNKKHIIIRRILAHNAGLIPYIAYWKTAIRKNGKYKCHTLSQDSSARFPIKITDDLFLYRNYKKKIYRMIRKSPVNPDQGYVYSGLAFYLWPEIVSILTGQDFETYLKNTFYRPLGAWTLTYNPYKHFSLDQIVPTENDTFFRHVQIHGRVHDEGAAMMNGVSGNAGLFGTATDLAKLMQMYQNMGSYGGHQYISRQTMKMFTTCQYCNEGVRRGLGFDKTLIQHKEEGIPAVDAGEDSFGHSGYTGTFTWADPDTGILFVFFSNRVYPTRENNRIADLHIRPIMHEAIYNSINQK